MKREKVTIDLSEKKKHEIEIELTRISKMTMTLQRTQQIKALKRAQEMCESASVLAMETA